ncbi:MAG: superoxide dismutase [Ni] [candidate division Zixibacteria bacterium]|nr:superoxide dismutase [Ni] [candidate division Zixibacteria bacterium]
MRYIVPGILFIGLAVLLAPATAVAHCQIPCGIYDDSLRFVMLGEDVTTIEKSMRSVTELSAAAEKDYNQIVRWVTNKDEHAAKFMEIVTDYFMAQRIKPVPPTDSMYNLYVKRVTVLHQMLVTAMKCKQTTDMENVTRLRQLVAEFKDLYF